MHSTDASKKKFSFLFVPQTRRFLYLSFTEKYMNFSYVMILILNLWIRFERDTQHVDIYLSIWPDIRLHVMCAREAHETHAVRCMAQSSSFDVNELDIWLFYCSLCTCTHRSEQCVHIYCDINFTRNIRKTFIFLPLHAALPNSYFLSVHAVSLPHKVYISFLCVYLFYP